MGNYDDVCNGTRSSEEEVLCRLRVGALLAALLLDPEGASPLCLAALSQEGGQSDCNKVMAALWSFVASNPELASPHESRGLQVLGVMPTLAPSRRNALRALGLATSCDGCSMSYRVHLSGGAGASASGAASSQRRAPRSAGEEEAGAGSPGVAVPWLRVSHAVQRLWEPGCVVVDSDACVHRKAEVARTLGGEAARLRRLLLTPRPLGARIVSGACLSQSLECRGLGGEAAPGRAERLALLAFVQRLALRRHHGNATCAWRRPDGLRDSATGTIELSMDRLPCVGAALLFLQFCRLFPTVALRVDSTVWALAEDLRVGKGKHDFELQKFSNSATGGRLCREYVDPFYPVS